MMNKRSPEEVISSGFFIWSNIRDLDSRDWWIDWIYLGADDGWMTLIRWRLLKKMILIEILFGKANHHTVFHSLGGNADI